MAVMWHAPRILICPLPSATSLLQIGFAMDAILCAKFCLLMVALSYHLRKSIVLNANQRRSEMTAHVATIRSFLHCVLYWRVFWFVVVCWYALSWGLMFSSMLQKRLFVVFCLILVLLVALTHLRICRCVVPIIRSL